MEGIFLLLGTNLGDRLFNLLEATNKIEQNIGTIKGSSSIYETAPWGNTNQPVFYNQVIRIDTTLTPLDMLNGILSIENEMGRNRIEKWGERIIDIDILYFNSAIIDHKELQVPHPEIAKRKFTLIPLADIAPDFIHPVLKESNSALLVKCTDALQVSVLDTSNL